MEKRIEFARAGPSCFLLTITVLPGKVACSFMKEYTTMSFRTKLVSTVGLRRLHNVKVHHREMAAPREGPYAAEIWPILWACTLLQHTGRSALSSSNRSHTSRAAQDKVCVLDSRSARGIHAGHRGNFGKATKKDFLGIREKHEGQCCSARRNMITPRDVKVREFIG